MILKTPVRHIKKSNIYEEVLAYLKSYIVENRLRPGDRLPTEAALAESLNVSRLSVREAIKILSNLGIVQSKTSDGTRLCDVTLKPATDHLRFLLDVEQVPIQEIAGARQMLECAIMPVIIAQADSKDYERISDAIEGMDAAIEAERLDAIISADSDFHTALLRATKNRAIDGFGMMLQEFFHYLSRNGYARFSKEEHKASLDQHRAIYEALMDANADKAASLMREHLHVYDSPKFAPGKPEQRPLQRG